jgi:truncated hemoglobin YjbI
LTGPIGTRIIKEYKTGKPPMSKRKATWSILFVFNGEELWEEYYGTKEGAKHHANRMIHNEEADDIIRIIEEPTY